MNIINILNGLVRSKITNEENEPVPVKGKVEVTGSLTSQSTEPKPAGEEGFSLSEYNPDTGEVKFYKYIAGDWREI